MGTRNLTMVINKRGETKVAQYGQWDGYPEGQGATILEFAKDKEKMKKLEEELENVKFFNECDDIKEYLEEYDSRCPTWSNEPDNRTGEDKYWFENLQSRDLGGKILDSIINVDKDCLPKEHNRTIYLSNQSDFGKESLMCEWAYCINFQTNKLECFCGFNKDKSKEYPRFATNQDEVDKQFDYADYRYYGVWLVKEYDLDNLPEEDEFVEELNKLTQDEED